MNIINIETVEEYATKIFPLEMFKEDESVDIETLITALMIHSSIESAITGRTLYSLFKAVKEASE